MNYNKNLIEDIIVCPNCGASLKKKENTYWCFGCKAKFPIVKDIPILLPSDLDKSFDFVFKKAQINFFDQWSCIKKRKKLAPSAFERYFSAGVGQKEMDYSERAMKKILQSIPKGSWILEVGCGAGEHSEFIARQRSEVNLVIIDVSFKSVLATKERLEKARLKGNVFFLVADSEKLPFRKNFFATIMMVMFFHHVFSLQPTLQEVKRTLEQKGICFLVDILADNPMITLPRKIFSHLPSALRKKFVADYVLKNGEIPEVKVHSQEDFGKAFNDAGLRITKNEPHDLFFFVFGTIGIVLPSLRFIFSERVLDLLYNIDKRALKIKFLSRFAGIRLLWLSH